jgi:alkylation response protein AidB-like acyl-CoA dehydrogenase
VADVFLAYATVNPELGALGVTAFIVEKDTPGVSVSKPMEKMGLRTSPMGEVIFEDCEIPREQLLGREGRGVHSFECSMEWERGCILAGVLGAMQRQLERSVRHAQQRKQFGQSIGKFQAVSHRITDMKVRLDTCRPLVYRIGRLKDGGKNARTEAAIAKLHVSESFVKSSMDAMRVFGGYGYMVEQEIERELRDAMGGVFYSGTSDIQRNIIARAMGL